MTETLSFPIRDSEPSPDPSRSNPRDSIQVTLRAFASDARVSEETSGSLGEPFSFRDAACVAAVSVTPLEETSLEDAFAVAREAVLADLAFPSAETHAPPVPEDARHSFPFDAEAERNRDEDAPGSPTSPLERLSVASSDAGSPGKARYERVARVPSRSRRRNARVPVRAARVPVRAFLPGRARGGAKAWGIRVDERARTTTNRVRIACV